MDVNLKKKKNEDPQHQEIIQQHQAIMHSNVA